MTTQRTPDGATLAPVVTAEKPDVAAKIRGAAAEKRVSQAQIANMLHTSRMAVSRRMNGHVPFTSDELIVLSQALGVPVATFFGEAVAA